MKPWIPLRSDASPSFEWKQAADLLRDAGSTSLSPGQRRELWGQVVLRKAARDRRMAKQRWLCVGAAACALAALAVSQVWDHGGRQAVVAEPEESVIPAPSARYWTEPGGAVVVASGKVEVRVRRRGAPAHLRAGELTVLVTDGRVLAEVDSSAARIQVFEGEAKINRGSSSVTLAGGESILSSDARLRASVLEGAAPGEGLAAQNALFLLGRTAQKQGEGERALALWRRYLERFPSGALAPEARLAKINQLVSLGRYSEARAAAMDYVQRYPQEPSTPHVARLAEGLRALQK